jgi:hypothetical protein
MAAPGGAVLDLGRSVRTVTPAQRRALIARDRGCIVPACRAGPEFCDGHHVRWWRHGGTTDLANLALLCQRHHSAVHAGHWDIIMIQGQPWARPPAWIDAQRRLIRNTRADAVQQAQRTGEQLRLTDPTD